MMPEAQEEKPDAFTKCWAQRDARHMKVMLKTLSLVTGAALLIAGVVGLSAIFWLQLVYFVGSIYTIIFGCIVMTVELRDRLPLISVLYGYLDVYLKVRVRHNVQLPALRRARATGRARTECSRL